MELADAFLVRTLFLLTPGIVACRIATSLRGSVYERAWEALVDSLMFATLGYVGAALAMMRAPASALAAFLDSEAKLDSAFVGAGSAASALIAAGFVAIDSRRGFHRLASRLELTTRVSNTDVWDWFLQGQVEGWHFVRDHARGLLFYGYIHAFSDSEKRRELWLRDVRVYDGTAEPARLLYEAKDLYWSGSPEHVTIETPSENLQ